MVGLVISAVVNEARLLSIWIKRARGGPMDAAEEAELVADRGLVGNAHQGGWRQVTIIARESWEAAEAELDAEIDPSARRANLLVEGVDLIESRGRVLRVGDCRIHLLGETRPCPQMEDARTGLMEALDPDWRGGAYGRVLDDGVIRRGHPVSWDGELPLPDRRTG